MDRPPVRRPLPPGVPSRRRRAAFLLGAAAVLTACTAAPTGPQRLSPELAADPLDLTPFAAAPCHLLDRPQLARYFVTTDGTPEPPGCRWTPADTAKLTYRAAVDLTTGGLEARYRQRPTIPGFTPAQVHSYPAILRDLDVGRCTVETGVANDTLLVVTVDAPDRALSAHADPCTEAERFAGTIIGYQGHRKP
ncbi:DUF3558 domain-containing protein [Amycolatopsis sp. NPDC004625]|uniref:DUF3558 domain-containing protein n=1 Tax=Amycolatopsis sp. NPDC004625 TaxID=3154670 RepID=UPI0033BABF2C